MKIVNYLDVTFDLTNGTYCPYRKPNDHPQYINTKSNHPNYIGLTEGTFKQRFSQHKATFKHRKYTNSTELSKYIWKLRDNNQHFNIKWTIISRARPYNNISKRCDLCLMEKLMTITANPDRTLNKRSELISKCHHENKFYLRNN